MPSPTPTRTAELLAAYLGGDRAAEFRLFATHRAALLAAARRHRLARVAVRYTPVEDVVDEVFLRVLSADLLRRFEDQGRGSLERLLLTILDRALKDACRRHGTLKRGGWLRRAPAANGEEDGALERCASCEPTPTSEARHHELLELARTRLDEREWEVWFATEVEGRRSQEIEARSGVPASTVRTILSRAREKLLLVLEPKANRT
ncbi:MAG: sigma-70 family RNA polymerase sigma factor [Planctomycetota bacterium]